MLTDQQPLLLPSLLPLLPPEPLLLLERSTARPSPVTAAVLARAAVSRLFPCEQGARAGRSREDLRRSPSLERPLRAMVMSRHAALKPLHTSCRSQMQAGFTPPDKLQLRLRLHSG